jgi:hypothetical protein
VKIKEAHTSLEEVVDEMVAVWREACSFGFRSATRSRYGASLTQLALGPLTRSGVRGQV